MARILEMIKEEVIAADIARYLGMSKPHVSYYINKLEKVGLVKQLTRDVITVYELTQAGIDFLDRYTKDNSVPPVCRAENIQFKATILKMPIDPVDWKRIQMHNWVQYTSEIDSVKVRINMGKNPTLELIPSPLNGDDPYDIYTRLVFECMNVIQTLNSRIGIEVGMPKLSSRGEWLVYDPLARAFCKVNGQVTYEGIAKVNASTPRKLGEFEFNDPKALYDYLLMPSRLKKIEKDIETIMRFIPSRDPQSTSEAFK